MNKLVVKPDCCLLFIDETGEESLKDPQFPVFGLGGCAVLGRDYELLIKKPWSELKTKHQGSAAVPLHAAGLSGKASREHLEDIGQFFRTHSFARFATVIKITTVLPKPLCAYQVVFGVLIERIRKVLRCLDPAGVAIIFESSERCNALAEKYSQNIQFLDRKGCELRTQWRFKPKSAHVAGLEVADFVVNSAGGRAKARWQGKRSARKDFECVFGSVPNHLVAFVELDSFAFANLGEPLPQSAAEWPLHVNDLKP